MKQGSLVFACHDTGLYGLEGFEDVEGVFFEDRVRGVDGGVGHGGGWGGMRNRVGRVMMETVQVMDASWIWSFNAVGLYSGT